MAAVATAPRPQPRSPSRGYGRWGIPIPVRDVPVGYIFEVITRGFGAMPDHAAQIPPADRWRIVAYVRTLQYAQKPEMGTAPGPAGGPVTGRRNARGQGPGGRAVLGGRPEPGSGDRAT